MARTLTEIYTEAKEARDKYLELTEIDNTSKMSVLNLFTWITSASIWTFENLLDVFKIDIANDLKNRINGTPAYYANSLLKYQSGDKLEMNEEGTLFYYPNIDKSKQIITKVSYSEYQEENFYDKTLLLKIATGNPGAYSKISGSELIAIKEYAEKIKFAGTKINVVSRHGDVLVPRITVYYDGGISEDEVYTNIENALNDFIANIDFDGLVYVQKVIDAIQRAEHVTDVYIDNSHSDLQGVFVAQYDDDDHLIPVQTNESGEPSSYERRVDRVFTPNSGFIRQSTQTGEETGIQTWRESIVLKIEDR